jgi:hypothetical protein
MNFFLHIKLTLDQALGFKFQNIRDRTSEGKGCITAGQQGDDKARVIAKLAIYLNNLILNMLEAFIPIWQYYHKLFVFRFNATLENSEGKFLVKADHNCYWSLMK